MLCKEGEVCPYIGYIEKGLIRQFYRKKELEVTEYLACENYLFMCVESFICCKPTHILVEALEDSTLYCFPHDKLMQLRDINQEAFNLYCNMLEESLVISQMKADSFRFESVKERYERFVRENPKIVQRVPLYHIASYLLTTPESLSRVRAGIY